MTTPELLPCPFCGDNRASTYHVRDGRVSMCPACGAKSGSQFNGPLDLPSADDRAIAAWNRRTPSPEVAALIAEARREERERMLCVLGEEYILKHASEGPDERLGRASAVRGVAVRMGLYADLDRAIAAAIRALKEETP